MFAYITVSGFFSSWATFAEISPSETSRSRRRISLPRRCASVMSRKSRIQERPPRAWRSGVTE